LAKIVDGHPDIAILMENIFANRRRHWQRAEFWDSPLRLRQEVEAVYARLAEPVVGNKVATPDVWDAGDIIRFCQLFSDFRILFVVRDPAAVALSRWHREPDDFEKVFNPEARKHILIDFRSRFHAYISSWRQSVENLWKLRDGYRERIHLVYYEDLCRNFSSQVHEIFAFLDVAIAPQVLSWHEMPHHDAQGALVRDLKYPDVAVEPREAPREIPAALQDALAMIPCQYSLWRQRKL